MAHFAELDSANVVLRVVVVADDIADRGEAFAAQWCADLFGGRWVQTSYNARIRRRYACVGDEWHPWLDAFVAPRPLRSWRLDEETKRYIPP